MILREEGQSLDFNDREHHVKFLLLFKPFRSGMMKRRKRVKREKGARIIVKIRELCQMRAMTTEVINIKLPLCHLILGIQLIHLGGVPKL